MITIERLGIRNSDENPVVETSTYIEVEPDHPMAVELTGHEGYWARIAVGNSLNQLNARPVSRAEFDFAQDEIAARVAEREAAAVEERARIHAEIAAKKAEIEIELLALGLSYGAIKAILAQIKG